MLGMTMKQCAVADGIKRVYTFQHGVKLNAFRFGQKDTWEVSVSDVAGNCITRDVWYDVYDSVIDNVTDGHLQQYLADVQMHDWESEDEC